MCECLNEGKCVHKMTEHCWTWQEKDSLPSVLLIM